jgi:hypothetical protein
MRKMSSSLFTFFELGVQFRLICRKERKGKRHLLSEEGGEGGEGGCLHLQALAEAIRWGSFEIQQRSLDAGGL